MTIADKLVLQRQRHLKWRAFDILEMGLMMLCGLLLFGFTSTVMFDIVTRTIGHPWLWLQEVTQTFFIYAIFVGTAVATRGKMKASTKVKPMTSTNQRVSRTKPTRPSQPDSFTCVA